MGKAQAIRLEKEKVNGVTFKNNIKYRNIKEEYVLPVAIIKHPLSWMFQCAAIPMRSRGHTISRNIVQI